MKYFTYQGNNHDCGFASLKMYLAILAKDKSYLYIPKPSKREKYTLEDLARISKSYGVPLECYGCSKESCHELDEPSLTLIDENHVVLVKKVKKRKIILYDPDRGKIKITKDEFLRRWRCVILTTNSPETVAKLVKIRHKIVPTKLTVFETISAILSSVILVSAFYFLNSTQNYVYSFIFLGLFLIFQIIEKSILYKQVYNFDTKYIPYYFEMLKNCKKKNYEEYIDYKRSFFVANRTFISSFLTALMITFLLCLNEFRNIFVLLALILIKLLEKMLLSKVETDSKNVIAELENKAFDEPSLTKSYALKANLEANRHIFYNSVKEIFYIFISFIFALTMMFVTGNSGCNYVIFHFVMYFTGFNSYNQFIDCLSFRKEIKRKQARFFDCCNL